MLTSTRKEQHPGPPFRGKQWRVFIKVTVISQASCLAHVTPPCPPSPTKLLSTRPRAWLMLHLLSPPPPPSAWPRTGNYYVSATRQGRPVSHMRMYGCGRITPASPPPASPPFRQGRRCEKSVPVDPRSAVPLPDTTPPPLTEAWPELGGSGRTWHPHRFIYAAGAGRSASPQKKEKVWQYWLPFAPVRLRLHDMPQNDGVLFEGGWPYDGQYWS